MTGKNRPMDHIRAARKLLQNPYAHVERLEEEAELSAAVVRSPLHRTEDPYATLASWNGEDDAPVALSPEAQVVSVQRPATTTIREFLSKADFRSECTRIFLPYVPPHLPRRVPQHQKDFIARNEQRSGKVRYRVAEALRRYDLSTTPGIAPQFNREHQDRWDEQKLRQIEAQIPDED
jgi:hypothetical protein